MYHHQQDLYKSSADEQWEALCHDKHTAHEHQEAACCQCLHDERTADEQVEVACHQCLCNEQRQCLLDKRDAHEHQEAAHQEAACAAQCLLDKQAALKCQEAVHHQRILNKKAAS